MQDLGAIMMITALAWPIIGGALVGLFGGLLKGRGLVGSLVSAVLGAAAGWALIMAFMLLSEKAPVPDVLMMPLTLGLPIVGGLMGLAIAGRFRRA